MAQGRVWLMNYDPDTPGGQVFQVNGTTPVGAADGITAGLYFKIGSGNTFTDPTGSADPTSAGWTLVTTGTSTASFIGLGYFQGTGDATITGTSATVPAAISLIVVAYSGSSYSAALVRGHSAAFNYTTAANTDAAPMLSTMPSFQLYNVAPIPEPSTFALAGLGLAGLLIFRRRN